MKTTAGFHGEKALKVLITPTEATVHMKEYYKECHEKAARGEPIVWTSTWEPQEILRAMDITPFYTIHYSALCSAKQVSPIYLDSLNNKGYFRDLCRYCSLPLGWIYNQMEPNPEPSPWGGMPEPTALVMSAMDDPCLSIYEIMAREKNAPLFILDRTHPTKSPSCWWQDPQIEPHRVKHMIREMEAEIEFLEVVTGKTFSMAKLAEVMEKTNVMFKLYGDALAMASPIVPSIFRLTDTFGNIIATQFFRGTDWGVQHAHRYYNEVKELVEAGVSAVENEAVRLIYDGVPLWFSPGFYNYFEKDYGAVFLPSSDIYTYGLERWVEPDLSNPLEALARRYIAYAELLFIPPFGDQWIIRRARESAADGVVMLLAESCKLLYTDKLFQKRLLEESGFPTLLLRADMTDARAWDDDKMKSLVESFIETLIQRKG